MTADERGKASRWQVRHRNGGLEGDSVGERFERKDGAHKVLR